MDGDCTVGHNGATVVKGDLAPDSVPPLTFTLNRNPPIEILRFGPDDAFYVRGVKVQTGPGEAAEVYRAFIDWYNEVKPLTLVRKAWKDVKEGDRVVLTIRSIEPDSDNDLRIDLCGLPYANADAEVEVLP